MDWNSPNNTAILQEIGNRIKSYRLRANLTQKEMAERAGISLFTVTKLERGGPVSLSMLIPVLRVLRQLDNLDLLLPVAGPSPVQMLRHKGRMPQRVRPKTKA